MARTPGSGDSRVRAAQNSTERFRGQVEQAVSRFGATVAPLLRAGVGQDEANLTSAVETLLYEVAEALGLNVLIHREASHQPLGIRPDFAVDVAGARVGVIELKAPGMGVPGSPGWGKSRDRAQWEKLKVLPNVLYSDGTSWAIYHYGVSGEVAMLGGDLARAGSKLRPTDSKFASVLHDFLLWKPTPPRDLGDLIRISAGLCHLLREEVAEALEQERRGNAKALFSEHLADWQEWLFPELTDKEFVDAFAQTITFGLLLARREGVAFEGLEIPDIGEKLAKRHLLVGRALSILTARPDRGLSIEERSIVLQTMRRVIGVADWTPWPAAGTYHWLYEEFLESYDPLIRRQMGAYYTPTAITDFMVRFVDEILRDKLGITRGLADSGVVVLDPAMGTGTFLQSVVDQVAQTVIAEGGDVPASLRTLLARLIGFERQIGPYAVAELKLDQALEAHQAEAKDEDFRLYVADTLDDPAKVPLPIRARMYAPLADSRRAANQVKTDEAVMVVLGNPPYRARAKLYGKWVLERNPGRGTLLDDLRITGYGRYEYKLHDLAIYFWRWALWKAFESTPKQPAGIVAFITTSAYLNGPGFAGMRAYLRRQADFGWIIDLSSEGHWSRTLTRVFPGVPHPVCIGVFARRSAPRLNKPASIRYLAVSGSQSEKFLQLASIQVHGSSWQSCPNEWEAPMRPLQLDTWTRCAPIDHLMPHTSLGVTSNRAWVHSPSDDVLVERWRVLVGASSTEKRRLMKETQDRTIDKLAPPLPGQPPKAPLRDEKSRKPRIVPIGFRSFDRQYLIADGRVIDRPRPDLWRVAGPGQVYLVTHIRESLTGGPAAVFSAHVPDTDHFRGHHGGRVIPLYRDTRRTLPNVAPKLLTFLRRRLGVRVRDEDLMAYVAGVISHPGYTDRFREELRQPGVRVPLTGQPDLWREAVALGRQIIWLHTFGERFTASSNGRPPGQPVTNRPNVLRPIPGRPDEMPDAIAYDEASRTLILGTGRIGPVDPAVWTYEVSGMRVVRHWFDYRKRDPSGRRGSPLDEITASRWTLAMTEELRSLVAVIESCILLHPQQQELLDRIANGPLITTSDLEAASIIPPPPAAMKIVRDDDDSVLF